MPTMSTSVKTMVVVGLGDLKTGLFWGIFTLKSGTNGQIQQNTTSYYLVLAIKQHLMYWNIGIDIPEAFHKHIHPLPYHLDPGSAILGPK